MDEFTALAQQVAVGAGDVRGCLIVSRDGLILGEFPAGDEAVAKPAWLRFAALGEPQKGFVEFPDQTWAYVHRGPYAAFAVAEPTVRPGLLMDRLEQALLIAEEARVRREPLRIAESVAPSGKPRTPLHPATPEPGEAPASTPAEVKASTPADVPVAAAATPDEATPTAVEERTAPPETPSVEAAPGPASPGPNGAATDGRPAQRPFTGDDPEETEVDRVLLAKEFSGLLQMGEDPDDAGS